VTPDEDEPFSHALTCFLDQHCVSGPEYSIADKQLFSCFRTFWMQTSEQFDHPSLLGKFRVELAQRGFLTNPGGKHPRWIGLALRKQNKQNRPEKPAGQKKEKANPVR